MLSVASIELRGYITPSSYLLDGPVFIVKSYSMGINTHYMVRPGVPLYWCLWRVGCHVQEV